ncbi:outer membrane beta-barrel protein [Salinimonas marina]|uniref:Outer membrane beta-barrel protein n=1 Tax=Salinimonas marina TaxID=2785918 RepID=A0A7S9DWB5_9ALTE|nr:outer membrane beta-barrel protein [Salinimonas marina]QPG05129.1 outer membrane beta-barrel protein [Salinimonas marina]
MVSYDGHYRAYKEYSKLDFVLHDFAAGARFDHTARFTTSFNVHYADQIELPGDTNAIAVARDKYIELSNKRLNVAGIYGTDKSIGQLKVEVATGEYDFNLAEQAYRDNTYNQATTTFFYRLAPKTRAFVEAGYADYDHQQLAQRPVQSNEVRTLRGGLEWKVTGKTTGSFQLGYQERDYDAAVFSDLSGLSYKLDMEWLPNTYTKVVIGSKRVTQESAIENRGGYINTDYFTRVSHDFSHAISGKLGYTFGLADLNYGEVQDFTRHQVELSGSWSWHPAFSTELSYLYNTRQSDSDVYEYKNNEISFVFRFDYERI